MPWSLRANISFLSVLMMDARLLYKNYRGSMFSLLTWTSYSQLSSDLLDNTYDSTLWCSRKSSRPGKGAVDSHLFKTGIHRVTTFRKRECKDGTLTNPAYPGSCCVCLAKSKRFWSQCRTMTGKGVFISDVDKQRGCFEQHPCAAHGHLDIMSPSDQITVTLFMA